MTTVKKILFISCSAGMGHLRAAEALCATSQERYPEIAVEHIDIAEYSSPLFKIPTTSGYASLVRYLPKIYGALYHASDKKTRVNLLSKFNFLIELNTKKLLNYIDNFNPDKIVCTHFLAPASLKKYYSKVPIDMVVTDYTAHQLWLSPYVNKYFVANEEVKKILQTETNDIIVSGLPIHPDFLKEKNNAEIKINFKIDNDWPTVLLTTGGFGLIDAASAVKKIINQMNNLNLVVITGKHNVEAYAKIQNLPSKKDINLVPIQFTEKISDWMRIADLVVTKPGGMTTTECLHLQKPLILIDPIPGQEEANVEFIEKNNYGQGAKNEDELIKIIKEVLANQKQFKKPAMDKHVNENILDEVIKNLR